MTLYIFPNTKNCATQRVNSNANYGLLFIIICQSWFINLFCQQFYVHFRFKGFEKKPLVTHKLFYFYRRSFDLISIVIKIKKKRETTEVIVYAAAAAAAAAAKSLQSCRTQCDPIDSSPPGFPIPGILQARTLEWTAISFFNA